MREKIFVTAAVTFVGVAALSVPLALAQDLRSTPTGESARAEYDAARLDAGDSPRDAEGGFPFGGSESTVQGYPGWQDVKQLQQTVRERGDAPGRVAGAMESRTQQAIREFQEANGLPATGTLDAPTAEALGVEPAGAGTPYGSTDPRR